MALFWRPPPARLACISGFLPGVAAGTCSHVSAAQWRPGASRSPSSQLLSRLLSRSPSRPPSQPLSSPTGKLCTTPTRLLKLILPLPRESREDGSVADVDTSTSDATEPVALLVHPQQPLSYVERLIQAELPGPPGQAAPSVCFRAASGGRRDDREDSGEGEGEGEWQRWSGSTEMGDFIREAARGGQFTVEVVSSSSSSSSPNPSAPSASSGLTFVVAVPSFSERMYFPRMRLRRLSRELTQMAATKRACDAAAQRSARRLAQGGFAALGGWWAAVYYVTFRTEYGWDAMEPVTYLASLGAIMGGYLWFLCVSSRRELSYRTAMDVTISRRQAALYAAEGFDMERWRQLAEEAQGLRAEIQRAAAEYEAEWEEAADLGEEVAEQLEDGEKEEEEKERTEEDKKKKGKEKKKKKEENRKKKRDEQTLIGNDFRGLD